MSIDVTPQRETQLSQQVAEEIRALLARRRVRQSQLARELQVSEQWLSVRLRGVQAIDLNDLQRIAAALGVRVVDLLPKTSGEPGSQTTAPYLDRHEQSDHMKDPSHSRPRDNRPNGHPNPAHVPPVQRRPARIPHAGQRRAA